MPQGLSGGSDMVRGETGGTLPADTIHSVSFLVASNGVGSSRSANEIAPSLPAKISAEVRNSH
jgi:hypothetical protein